MTCFRIARFTACQSLSKESQSWGSVKDIWAYRLISKPCHPGLDWRITAPASRGC